MGKTADLTVVQKTLINTLYEEGKPQKVIAERAGCSQSAVSKHIHGKLTGREKCGRKRCTSNRDDRSLERIVRQSQFKNLGELHKEWTEAGVSASRATTHRRVQELGYKCCISIVKPLLNQMNSDDSGDTNVEKEWAALKMEEDGENSLLSMTLSQDGAPPESLTDPYRVDWPKLLVNRSKRRKRRRRTEKAAALSGSEKVKIIDMTTGKKVGAAYGPTLQDLRVFLEENPDCAVAPEWAEAVRNSGLLPDNLFHRLLSTNSVLPKRSHHHHVPQPAPLEDPLLGGGEEETLVSDGAYMMEDQGLEDSSFLIQTFDVKMEGGDSLSQGGYDNSEREAILDDVMVQKDSDSSSSSED